VEERATEHDACSGAEEVAAAIGELARKFLGS
jgi:hypothetical protein